MNDYFFWGDKTKGLLKKSDRRREQIYLKSKLAVCHFHADCEADFQCQKRAGWLKTNWIVP
ncbi:hypothetical protein D3Z36_04360 [Lachnospiraceae bacterium]|nr:hypothetical protein [Lachnospiraceae bacterium]